MSSAILHALVLAQTAVETMIATSKYQVNEGAMAQKLGGRTYIKLRRGVEQAGSCPPWQRQPCGETSTPEEPPATRNTVESFNCYGQLLQFILIATR